METKPNGKLGLIPCVAIIVGGCIGSAIYSLSGMTMYYAGASAILSWVIAALILPPGFWLFALGAALIGAGVWLLRS